MEENQETILSFWSEFEFEIFEKWLLAAGPLPADSSSGYYLFCREQQLTFCTNCEPMCTIHQNCIIHDICDDGSPFNQDYWTPLIEQCCSLCNVKCETAPSLNVAQQLAPVSSTSTSSTSTSISTSFTSTAAAKDNSLINVLSPLLSIVLLGLIIFGIFYQKQQKCMTGQCSATNSETKDPCTLSDQHDDEDISDISVTKSTTSGEGVGVHFTDIPITELWERIKSDDNYDSKFSRPGAFNRAPLASVLNLASSDI